MSEFLGVTVETVRRWIRTGVLIAEKKGNKYVIPETENAEFLIQKIKQKQSQPDTPFVPKEIETYDKWHTLLDELCWLVKITYSSRENLKSKKFRLDTLLSSYLQTNSVCLSTVARAIGNSPLRETTVAGDLKRGWYNELAFAFPLKISTLGLTFRDIHENQDASDDRFLFPSWRIVSAYYASYFYLRSLTV